MKKLNFKAVPTRDIEGVSILFSAMTILSAVFQPIK